MSNLENSVYPVKKCANHEKLIEELKNLFKSSEDWSEDLWKLHVFFDRESGTLKIKMLFCEQTAMSCIEFIAGEKADQDQRCCVYMEEEEVEGAHELVLKAYNESTIKF